MSAQGKQVGNALGVHWSDAGRDVVDFDNGVQLSGGWIPKPDSLLSWGQQGGYSGAPEAT